MVKLVLVTISALFYHRDHEMTVNYQLFKPSKPLSVIRHTLQLGQRPRAVTVAVRPYYGGFV
jgi:hypothetical protein